MWQAPPPLEGTVNTLPNWNIWIGTTIEYMCQEGLFSVTGAAATNATAALSGWTVFDPDFRCVPGGCSGPGIPQPSACFHFQFLVGLIAMKLFS